MEVTSSVGMPDYLTAFSGQMAPLTVPTPRISLIERVVLLQKTTHTHDKLMPFPLLLFR
jgi:hypothetical protein